ncbi:MAG: 16S rRNA (adenine(1518)-N(6)/adenine(1519)-N(6))-dimethyltransferase RsmA [Pseudomonadales bacterium]|nr:16S rRNA (adenine(1518)-N(6)/adenine(1519)-N(6))-dimethyltransferase RsmA [Pseudomonadales bacterium]
MKTPQTRSAIDRLPEHRARKRFGQNFLHDPTVIQRIIHAINPQAGQHLVEIGPGQAALTTHLLSCGATLDVIELDRDLAGWLHSRFGQEDDFCVHQADVLKFDIGALQQDTRLLRIIGNLPYNISTPCLFHLLRYHAQIEDMVFMLQHEVVQRLAAGVGDPAYGRLGIMMQYFCAVEPLFMVPPGAFRPQPKVNSAIVRLRPYRELPLQAKDFSCLQKVVRTAFNQRRKTLKNSLSTLISATDSSQLPIDLSLRPENLGLADYIAISDAITDASGSPADSSGEHHHAEPGTHSRQD